MKKAHKKAHYRINKPKDKPRPIQDRLTLEIAMHEIAMKQGWKRQG